MRVSAIYTNGIYQNQKNKIKVQKRECLHIERPESDSQFCGKNENINFKGKFGMIVGGAVGFAATFALALVAPPAAGAVLSCLTGGGAFVGAGIGDYTEDKVNGENNNKDDKK